MRKFKINLYVNFSVKNYIFNVVEIKMLQVLYVKPN